MSVLAHSRFIMKRQFKSRPAPVTSAMTAVVGVFMLIFAIVFITQEKALPAVAVVFFVVWFVALIGIILYHVLNATRSGGVPTEIIESEGDASAAKSSAERLRELEDLRSRKLISEAEYEAKRQEILKEV